MKNKVDRRIFFEKLGKASLVMAAASMLPIKIFGGKKRTDKKVQVKVHPAAVKRNKV